VLIVSSDIPAPLAMFNVDSARSVLLRIIHITKRHAGILGRCAIHAAIRRGKHHLSAVRLGLEWRRFLSHLTRGWADSGT
jgi:hypothetical protein